MHFDNADDITPLQEFDLHPDPQGKLDYPTKASKFQNLHSLTIYVKDNYGADTTKIHYIGLSGEFKQACGLSLDVDPCCHVHHSYVPDLLLQMKRDTIITVYELNANPADHKLNDELKPHSSIS